MLFINQKLKVKAILLDLDGTLIDSAPLYYQIIDIVFERLGVPSASRETLQEAMDDGDFDWDFVLPASTILLNYLISQYAILKSLEIYDIPIVSKTWPNGRSRQDIDRF